MRIRIGMRRGQMHREGGMSLIELMLAMTMLAVGLAGVLVLITTAISSNNRNKLDTEATLTAQAMLDTIAAQTTNNSLTVTDCAGTVTTVNTVGSATAGSALGAALTSAGTVDFTQAQSAIASGYKASYVTCGSAGRQITYDIRWNILTIDNFSKLITVSARQAGAAQVGANTSLRFFMPPVTLRTIAVLGN